LTDHFYAFTGMPGDVLITIETQNLNGDMDVFTAGSLRPVFKVGLYAETSSSVSKSFYLRQREDLILRVEARTPNDDDGIYHIRFGGSFQPIIGGPEAVEEASANPETQPRRGKRVSSVGARINEPTPPPEVAAAPTPEPTPAATPELPAAEPKAESAEPAAKSRSVRSLPTTRRGRNKSTTDERAPTKPPTEPKAAGEAESAATTPAESEAAPKSRTSGKGRNATKKSPEVSKSSDSESASAKARKSKVTVSDDTNETQPAVQGESKLIIEMMDGSRIERSMSAIRRVTVESGQILVTGKDGKVERIRLARVLRMSIGQ